MKLSFVIPCYRSENTIETVVQEIRDTVATRPGTDYEIVLVNDCSPDGVWQVIKRLAAEDSHIRGICLAKNFGQHCALVYGYYEHSAQHLFRRFGTWVNKKMAEAIIGQPKTLRTTSFFIMRKFIVDEIVRYPHPFAYISGLVFRATKNLGNVEVQHRRRIEGESGYTIAGLIGLWINGFTAFSVKPLRAATFIGVICALVGFVAGLYVVYQKFLNPEIPVGYTSMLATLLFVGGMIMLLLGLIGEYVGRIYISINQSPQYVVRERTF